jgi:hypothetical protein
MITLFRWYLYKTKEIKWKCALWMELDKQLTTLMKNPEQIEKKIFPYLAELVHNSVTAEKERMAKGEFGVK